MWSEETLRAWGLRNNSIISLSSNVCISLDSKRVFVLHSSFILLFYFQSPTSSSSTGRTVPQSQTLVTKAPNNWSWRWFDDHVKIPLKVAPNSRAHQIWMECLPPQPSTYQAHIGALFWVSDKTSCSWIRLRHTGITHKYHLNSRAKLWPKKWTSRTPEGEKILRGILI